MLVTICACKGTGSELWSSSFLMLSHWSTLACSTAVCAAWDAAAAGAHHVHHPAHPAGAWHGEAGGRQQLSASYSDAQNGGALLHARQHKQQQGPAVDCLPADAHHRIVLRASLLHILAPAALDSQRFGYARRSTGTAATLAGKAFLQTSRERCDNSN